MNWPEMGLHFSIWNIHVMETPYEPSRSFLVYYNKRRKLFNQLMKWPEMGLKVDRDGFKPAHALESWSAVASVR